MCRCENDEGEPRCYRGFKSDAYCTLSVLERQLSEIDARSSASTADIADDCIVVRRTTEFVCVEVMTMLTTKSELITLWLNTSTDVNICRNPQHLDPLLLACSCYTTTQPSDRYSRYTRQPALAGTSS